MARWQDAPVDDSEVGIKTTVPVLPAGTMRVSPQQQAVADRARLNILENEAGLNPNDPALQREVAAARTKQGAVQTPRWQSAPEAPVAAPQPPRAAAQQQPAYLPYQEDSDPYADVGRFGENPGTGKGGAEFHQGIASTPARLVKSLAQLAGVGQNLRNHPVYGGVAIQPVADVVNKSAQVANTGFGTAGRIVGDVAATVFPAAKVGQATQGFSLPARLGIAAGENAAYNAALSPDQQGEAALYGAALGPVGHLLGSAAGGLVRPTPEARFLMDRGVALTPGQAAGTTSFVKKAEEYLGTLPIANHFIRGAQNRAVEDANVAAAQAVRNMIDNNVKLGRPPREAIEATREAISDAYTRSLDGAVAPTIGMQGRLVDRVLAQADNHPMLTPEHGNRIASYVQNRFSNMPKELTGDQMKRLDSELGDHIRTLYAGSGEERTAAKAWRDLQYEVRQVIAEAQGDVGKREMLLNANKAYKELLTLERAMLPGNDVFTPRRLKMTLERMNKGQVPDNELGNVSRAMSATLPNQVPSSGTAERLLFSSSLPAILGLGGAGAQGMGYGELGTGMMAAGALGSRAGTRFMTGGMPGQMAFVEALRQFVPKVRPGKRDDERK